MCSNNLQEIQVRDTGRYLTAFLKIGATLARVHSAGKSPVFRDCSKIKSKTGVPVQGSGISYLRYNLDQKPC